MMPNTSSGWHRFPQRGSDGRSKQTFRKTCFYHYRLIRVEFFRFYAAMASCDRKLRISARNFTTLQGYKVGLV